MSTVTLTIGPKSYSVACADGEEAHIQALGTIIAEKYNLLGASRAPLEAQNLLFAALFLADELAEARKRGAPEPASEAAPVSADPQAMEALRSAIAQLEDDLAAARAEAAVPAAAATPPTDLFAGADPAAALADQLEAIAARVEASASALEAAAASA
jgi:cell division protein ZapA